MKHNEKPYKISEDQEYINNNNITPNLKITEIYYPTQRGKTRKKLESNIIEQKNKEQNKELLYKNPIRIFEKITNVCNLIYKKKFMSFSP